MADPRSGVVGTWELIAWQLIGPDGAIVEPFGPAPQGLLVYGADGFMSVVITARDRSRLPDVPTERTSTEKAAAFDGAHAYAGTWALLPGEIVHRVRVSALPNYEGTEQRRRLHLDGDRLTLTTPPGRAAHIAPDSGVVGRLTWRRARDDAE
jgi:hypothetical protein